MTDVFIITGLSGAGKTTALHSFEDLGFFCIDNLPPAVSLEAVRACEGGDVTKIGLGVDVRVGTFLGSIGATLEQLRGGGRNVQILFLDASDETLMRRFSETRRPHPMNLGGSGDTSAGALLEGIRIERERLASLRALATHVLDTTHLSVHDLRKALLSRFGAAGIGPKMRTRLLSFGFKYGIPTDADLVLDVRFIENPYFVPALKHLPGTHPSVAKFVHDQADTVEFLEHAGALLESVLPKYEREGKSYLTIAIGCTGGRHRSVAIAEALAARLRPLSQGVTVVHRDVQRQDLRVDRPSNPEIVGLVSPRSFPPPPKKED
ncbi:MAG: RNase adapter RapZ [Polyangiaceae bacterium]|nr:RNase adapter RapZ [Polyangiaceae bacterium]